MKIRKEIAPLSVFLKHFLKHTSSVPLSQRNWSRTTQSKQIQIKCKQNSHFSSHNLFLKIFVLMLFCHLTFLTIPDSLCFWYFTLFSSTWPWSDTWFCSYSVGFCFSHWIAVMLAVWIISVFYCQTTYPLE